MTITCLTHHPHTVTYIKIRLCHLMQHCKEHVCQISPRSNLKRHSLRLFLKKKKNNNNKMSSDNAMWDQFLIQKIQYNMLSYAWRLKPFCCILN